ncbi:MAG TPA: hypothetical protein VMD30_12450, partial [Tepidisphaeraceae bacterium]|nr:hypothetical protein [Tepidisphaeraceae bacterium]
MNFRRQIKYILAVLYVLSLPNLPCFAQTTLVDSATDFTKWDFLILARVNEAMVSQSADSDVLNCTYHVRVVCEYRNRIAPDSEIIITGSREPGSMVVEVPIMGKGDFFIMPIERATQTGTY